MTNVAFTTAGQRRFVYWLNAYGGVPAAILTPVITHYQLKQSRLSPEERRQLVMQEVVRQAVSSSIHFLCFFGIGALAKNGFKRLLPVLQKGTAPAVPSLLQRGPLRWVGAGLSRLPGAGTVRQVLGEVRREIVQQTQAGDELLDIIGGQLGEVVGYGVLRPWVANDLIVKLLYPPAATPPPRVTGGAVPGTGLPPVSAPPLASRARVFQAFSGRASNPFQTPIR